MEFLLNPGTQPVSLSTMKGLRNETPPGNFTQEVNVTSLNLSGKGTAVDRTEGQIFLPGAVIDDVPANVSSKVHPNHRPQLTSHKVLFELVIPLAFSKTRGSQLPGTAFEKPLPQLS